MYKNIVAAMCEPVEIGKHETVNSLGTESSSIDESIAHVEELLSQSSLNLN